jgi:hypothetical protein
MTAIRQFLDDVQRDANAATPSLIATLLSTPIPSRYCLKCRTLLVKYVSLKLMAHHAKKRSWRWLHRTAALTNQMSSFELEAKIQSARAAFYNEPCECGEREDYVK